MVEPTCIKSCDSTARMGGRTREIQDWVGFYFVCSFFNNIFILNFKFFLKILF